MNSISNPGADQVDSRVESSVSAEKPAVSPDFLYFSPNFRRENDLAPLLAAIESGIASGGVTPSTNRGVFTENRQNDATDVLSLVFGVGWISASFSPSDRLSAASYARSLSRLYCRLTGDKFKKVGGGKNSYEATILFDGGAFIAYTPGRRDICISIPQTVCDWLDAKQTRALLHELCLQPGAHFTRLDLYFDDFSHTITVGKAIEAKLAKNVIARSKTWFPAIKYNGDTPTSEIVYFGSVESNVLLRIYNKALESKGAHNSTRVELQLRKDDAHAAATVLFNQALTDWNQMILGMIMSKIDFKDRSSSSKTTTAKRLDWWQALVGGGRTLKFRAPQKPRKLERFIAYVENTLSASLAAVAGAVGLHSVGQWLMAIIKEGKTRFRPYHQTLIDNFLENAWKEA